MVEEAVNRERLYRIVHARIDDLGDDGSEALRFDLMTPYTVGLAVNYFLSPAKHREVYERLVEDEVRLRVLESLRRDRFVRHVLNTLGAAPVTRWPGELYHFRRFLRATLARLHNSMSYSSELFCPGDLKIVIRMDHNSAPFPDPDTHLYTIG